MAEIDFSTILLSSQSLSFIMFKLIVNLSPAYHLDILESILKSTQWCTGIKKIVWWCTEKQLL